MWDFCQKGAYVYLAQYRKSYIVEEDYNPAYFSIEQLEEGVYYLIVHLSGFYKEQHFEVFN